jgi:nitrile hydratase
MHDPLSHVHAVASDLEYFRRKRLVPHVLFFARRGIVPLPALLRVHERVDRPAIRAPANADFERRIRNLEDRLDDLILAISVTNIPLRTASVTIDDMRVERGDYDEFFRVTPQEYTGSLDEQIAKLEDAIAESMVVIATFTQALVDRGEVTQGALDRRREELASLGHRNGARIVARAWTDRDFKERLLHTGREAARELDIPPGRLGKLGVAENTPDTHNVVVCTLCSCYPHDLLGNPPWWYRSDTYKRRIVEDPRAMLGEMFGLSLPEGQAVTVHDSTSDVRWMVLPMRPEGTEDMSEEELADLVTPDSLIGVARALPASGDEPVTVRL